MATVYKGAGTSVAKLPGIQPELDKAARSILNRAKAAAAGRVKSGAYMRSFGVEPTPGKKGVTDRLVYNDDPGAVPIEFGHLATGEGGMAWVPGQRIFLTALYGGR